MGVSNGYREFHEHAGPISAITITCSLLVMTSVWISTDWLSYPGLITALAFFSLSLFYVTAREVRSRSKVMRVQGNEIAPGVIPALRDQQPQEAQRVQIP